MGSDGRTIPSAGGTFNYLPAPMDSQGDIKMVERVSQRPVRGSRAQTSRCSLLACDEPHH